jgi:endogenous inhibitor of DNA gyrase (YacG/DUF329 family)
MTPYVQENAFRPFCSERCKLIDLGAWAQERYAIAGTPEEGSAAYQAAFDGDVTPLPIENSKLDS